MCTENKNSQLIQWGKYQPDHMSDRVLINSAHMFYYIAPGRPVS